MDIYEETKLIMKQYNIHPNKNLGQNFIVDENALEKITSEINNEDIVIEIGPGIGSLTALIAEKAKKVYAIELDKNMVNILQKRFMLYDNIEIINKDVLNIDLDELAPNAKIVANLPYYITTPIITHVLKSKIESITVLIQKEVAERICAKTGTKKAGAITYFIEYYAKASIIANVPKESFIPQPKVESSIVKIEKMDNNNYNVKDEQLLFDIIKTNFSQRRKTLVNALSNSISKDIIVEILNKLNIDINIRGENLTLEQYIQIVNML